MSTQLQHFGKYAFQQCLGQDGVVEVWKAFDTQLQRAVTIKILHVNLQADPQFLRRFVHEARMLAALHHPNIVRLHDFQVIEPSSSAEGLAYMVMDEVAGQSLAHYIEQTSAAGKFPSPAEIVHLFTALANALDYAHQHGFIHRALTPSTVLLDTRHSSPSRIGEPVLTDFGMARLLAEAPTTLSGSWQNRSGYLSPEQLMGQVGTERSDLYALGAILYEVCAGVAPFEGNAPSDIVRQQLSGAPIPPDRINPALPPAVTAVILRSLSKDPAARFPSASALASALASAWGLPHMLNTPAYPVKAFSSQPSTPVTPAFPPVPQTPSVAGSAGSTREVPGSTPPAVGRPPIANTAMRNASAPAEVLPTAGSPVLAPSVGGKRRKRRLVALVVALLLMLVGSGLAARVLFLPQQAPRVARGTVVGRAFFISSGALNESTAQGLEDQLQITLDSLPAPAAGKAYYAWLLNDKAEKSLKALFLGKLRVDSGHVDMLYKGDGAYTNLIATMSRFLITEEDANKTPAVPTLDQHAWRYYAEIAQTVPNIPGRPFSALIHLRHILYEGPILSKWGIHGGGNVQLLRNTQKILEWSESARDAWGSDSGFIHRQVVRILDYMDGSPYVQQDVPPGTPLLVEPRLAQVPLITVMQGQNVPSYLSRVHDHVGPLGNEREAPGLTPAKHALAIHADLGLAHLQQWLSHVRQDARQLVMMDDAQLLQPAALSLLNDMRAWANIAFVGQRDPATNEVQWGAVQLWYSIQQLATFDVKVYQ